MFTQMTVIEELASLKKALALHEENHSELWRMYNKRNDEYWDMHNRAEIFRAAVIEISDLMNDSTGVTGYHESGNPADWDSLNLPCFKAAIDEHSK
jgi:hypothetical protein